MSEVLGYVSGNAIVAEQDLQKFDGCKVRIAVMDKRPLETERRKRPFRSFGMARGELRYQVMAASPTRGRRGSK